MQAFVVAGGWGHSYLSSVLLLDPGAEAWLPIASLPLAVKAASGGSILGGRLRVSGGLDGGITRNEVKDNDGKVVLLQKRI